MRAEFTVTDYPPKKHGEKSMFAQPSEALRVAHLRESAFEARLRAGLSEPFYCLVALEPHVFVPGSRLESVGDLDSFIAGVCDSLQAAHSNVLTYLDEALRTLKKGAYPKHALLITNDTKVVSITARKIPLKENKDVYYEVAVEPLI